MSEDILKNKINLFAENLAFLEQALPKTFDEFQEKNIERSACERFFQIIIDSIVDCNQILIEKSAFPASDTYFNTFSAVARTGLFPQELLEILSHSVGTRNAIVHRYETIQLKREFEDIQKYLPLCKEYLKIISQIL